MVVAANEVDIPESWSGVVHDAPFVRHAKPRSWLEWAQLLYSERHLHPRGDGRVAPATALPAFTLCDVAVSRAYTLEMTATAGGEKRVTRGRFAEKTIAERWPRGGFVRGVYRIDCTRSRAGGHKRYGSARSGPELGHCRQ